MGILYKILKRHAVDRGTSIQLLKWGRYSIALGLLAIGLWPTVQAQNLPVFNRGAQLLVSDPMTGRVTVLDRQNVSRLSMLAPSTEPGAPPSPVFKQVSGDVKWADRRLERGVITSAGKGQTWNRLAHYTPPINRTPFQILNPNNLLINTQNIGINWTVSTSDVAMIDRYELLQWVTQNQWVSVSDSIPATANRLVFPSDGGTFVMRRWFKNGDFDDTDNEAIDHDPGLPELRYSVAVDIIPPVLATSSVCITVTTDSREAQSFRYQVSELGTLVLDVTRVTLNMDTATPDYFVHLSAPITSPNGTWTWNGTNDRGVGLDGVFTLTYRAIDLAGNTSNVVSASVVYDTFPPVLTYTGLDRLVTPLSSRVGSWPVTIEIGSDERATMNARLVGTSNATIKQWPLSPRCVTASVQLASGDITPLADGDYQLVIQAADQKEHLTSRSILMRVDQSSPSINVVSLPVVTAASPIGLATLQINEPAAVTLSVLSIVVTANTSGGHTQFNLGQIVASDNRHPVAWTVTDWAGNISTGSTVLTVDRTPPDITEWNITDIIRPDATGRWRVTAEDAMSPSVSSTLRILSTGGQLVYTDTLVGTSNSVAIRPTIFDAAVTSQWGRADLTVRDGVGNDVTVTRSVLIGSSPPHIAPAPLPMMSFHDSSTLTLSAVVSDGTLPDIRRLSVELIASPSIPLVQMATPSIGTLNWVVSTASLSGLVDGVYPIRWLAESRTGLIATVDTSLNVDMIPPTINAIQPITSIVNASGQVHFQADASDKSGRFTRLRATLLAPDPTVSVIDRDMTVSPSMDLVFSPKINGQVLADGSHRMAVEISDAFGQTREAIATFTIDTIPPQVAATTNSLVGGVALIQPGTQASVTFVVTSNEETAMTMTVVNDAKSPVRTIHGEQRGNTSQLTWNGLSTTGGMVDGEFNAVVSAVDAAGNITTRNLGVVVVQNAPSLSGVWVSKAIFPAGEAMTIGFDASRAGKVNASVINSRGVTVSAIVTDQAVTRGSNSLTWRGLTPAQQPLPDGEYTILMQYIDSRGVPAGTASKLVEIDSTRPQLTDVTVNRTVLGIPGAGIIRSSARYYETASVNIRIKWPDGQLAVVVPTADCSPTTAPVDIAIETALNGRVGNASLEWTLTDRAGNTTQTALPIYVLSNTPLRVQTSPSIVYFSPNGDSVMETAPVTLSGTGSGGVSVSATIQSVDGATVRELAIGASLSSPVLCEWDGRNKNLEMMRDNQYRLDIRAWDDLGHTAHTTVPIILTQAPIQLVPNLPTGTVSINGDSIQDTVGVGCDVRYPNSLLDAPGYTPQVTLKAVTTQFGATIAERWVTVRDSYSQIWDPTGLVDGPFEITLTGEDAVRSYIAPLTLAYINDTQPPTASVIGVTTTRSSDGVIKSVDESLSSHEVSLVFPASGISTITVYNGSQIVGEADASTATGTMNYVPLSLADGHYNLTYVMTDLGGNIGATQSVAITIDTIAPTLISAAQSTATRTRSAGGYEMTLTMSEPVESDATLAAIFASSNARLGIESLRVSSNQIILSYRVTADSSNVDYYLDLNTSDAAGNMAQIRHYVATVDTVPPQPPILVSAPKFSASPSITLNCTIEPGSSVSVIDGATGTALTTGRIGAMTLGTLASVSIPVTLTEGSHTLQLIATDAAGNQSLATEMVTECDFTPPRLANVRVMTSTGAGAPIDDHNQWVLAAGTYTVETTWSEPVTGSIGLGGASDGSTYTSGARSDRTTYGTLTIDPSATNQVIALDGTLISDQAGNITLTPVIASVSVDTVPPQAARVGLANQWVSAQLSSTASVHYDPVDTLVVRVDQQIVSTWGPGRSDVDVPLTFTSGDHVVEFETRDRAGNHTSVLRRGIVDITPPVLTSARIDGQVWDGIRGVSVNRMTIDVVYSEPVTPIDEPVFRCEFADGTVRTAPLSMVSPTEYQGDIQFLNGDTGTPSIRISPMVDQAGIIAIVPTLSLHVDTTPPPLPVVVGGDITQNSRVVSLRVSVDPTAATEVYCDNRLDRVLTGSSGTPTVSFTLDPGTHRIVLQSIDPVGNTSGQRAITVVIDLTPPVIVTDGLALVTVIPAGSYHGTLAFSEPIRSTASITLRSPSASIPVAITAIGGPTISTRFVIPEDVPNGRYTVQAEVTDGAGNAATLISSRTYSIDTIPPTPPTWAESSGAIPTSSYSTLLQVEPGTTATIWVDDQPRQSLGATAAVLPVTIPLSEGTHQLSATLTDAAGNRSAVGTTTITVDLSAPTLVDDEVSLTRILGPGTYRGQIRVSEALSLTSVPSIACVSSGNTIPVSVISVSGNIITTAVTIQSTALPGEYHIVASNVVDRVGNVSQLQSSVSYTVDVTPPATPRLTRGESLIRVPEFSDTVQAELGTTLSISIDGTSLTDILVDQSLVPISMPLPEGRHSIVIVSTDRAGNRSTPLNHWVSVDLTAIGLVTDELSQVTDLTSGTYTGKVTFTEPLGAAPTLALQLGSHQIPVRVTSWSGATAITECRVQPPTVDGVYTLVAIARDIVGNSATLNGSIAYHIDTLAPTTPGLLDPITLTNATDYPLTIQAEVGCRVRIYDNDQLRSDDIQTDTTQRRSIILTPGTHRIDVDAMDAATNLSPRGSLRVTVDITSIQVTGIDWSLDLPMSTAIRSFRVNLSEPMDLAKIPSLEFRTFAGVTRNATHIVPGISANSTSYITADIQFEPGDDGATTLTIDNVTDVAGNRLPPLTTRAFTVDTVAPVAPTITSAAPLTNSSNYYLSLSGEAGTRVDIRDDGGIIASTLMSSSSRVVPLTLTEGTHSLNVTLVDTAGNSSPITSQLVRVDLTPPSISDLVIPSSSPVSANTYPIAFTVSEIVNPAMVPSVVVWTASGGARPVVLSDYSGTIGRGHVTVLPGDDGPATVAIDGIMDQSGNTSAHYSGPSFIIDTTAPEAPRISSPTPISPTTHVTVRITGESNSTAIVRDNGHPVLTVPMINGSADGSLTLDEGDHTLSTQLMDSAGNISDIAACSVVVDLTPPTIVTMSMGMASPVSANQYAIYFSTSESIPLDGLPTVRCITAKGTQRPVTLTQLTSQTILGTVQFESGDDGASQIQIDGLRDTAGNQGPHRELDGYFVDTIAPDAPDLGSSNQWATSTAYSLPISGETGAVLALSDNGTVVRTTRLSTSPQSVELTLGEGAHTLTATLTDSAGNLSRESRQTVTVDITVPVVIRSYLSQSSPVSANVYPIDLTISEALQSNRVPVVTVFTASGLGRPVSLTPDSATHFVGSVTFLPGDDGQSRIDVSGLVDLAGNTSVPYQTNGYRVDTIPPATPTVVSANAISNSSQITRTIVGELGCQLTLRDNGNVLVNTPMTSSPYPVGITLEEGNHELSMMLTDAALNQSALATESILVDTTPPDIQSIESSHLNHSEINPQVTPVTVTLNVAADPSGIQYFSAEVYRDGRLISTRQSLAGHFLFGQAEGLTTDGTYIIQCSVVDGAGNHTRGPSVDIRVDTVAPVAPITQPIGPTITSTQLGLDITAEVGTTISITVDDIHQSTVSQTAAHTHIDIPLTEGSHRIAITAIDRAGNVSLSTTVPITVDVTAPQIVSMERSGVDPIAAGTYRVTLTISEATSLATVPTINLITASGRIVTGTIVSRNATQLTAMLLIGSGDDGASVIEVSGLVDVAGNPMLPFRGSGWTIDTIPPAAPTFTGAPSATRSNGVNFTVISEPDTALRIAVDAVTQPSVTTNGTQSVSMTLAEGSHTIAASVRDAAGNLSPTTSRTLIVDQTPLAIIQFSPSTPSGSVHNFNSSPVTISITTGVDLSGFDQLMWYVTDTAGHVTTGVSTQNPAILSFNRSSGIVSDTRYTIDVDAIDRAGNITRAGSVSVTNDTISPSVTAVTLESDLPVVSGGRDITVRVTHSEPVSATYNLVMTDGTVIRPTAALTEFTSVAQPVFRIAKNMVGTANITVATITDLAGNLGVNDSRLVVPIDAKAPDVTLGGVTTTTSYGMATPLTVNLQFSEPVQSGLATVQLVRNSGALQAPTSVTLAPNRSSITAQFDIPAVEETMSVKVSGITDDRGNAMATTAVSLGVIDTTPPMIREYSANVPTFSAIRNVGSAAVVITLNIHEDYSGLTVRIYDTSGALKMTLKDSAGTKGLVVINSWDGKDYTGHDLPKGWYVMRAWATDYAGNTSIPVEGLFEVTEQHLTLTNALQLALPYSFKASGPKKFTYSLRERIDAPDSSTQPGGIRPMAETPVAKITEKIFQRSASGSDILIATLATNQSKGVFENDAVGQWNGYIDNDASKSLAGSGSYYMLVSADTLTGRTDASLVIPFVVDHTDPVATGVTISARPISTRLGSNNSLSVTVNISDNSTPSVDLKVILPGIKTVDLIGRPQGISTMSLSVSGVTASMTDGITPVILVVNDCAYNTVTLNLSILADSTVPSFTVTAPSYVSTNLTVAITGVSDISTTSVTTRWDATGTWVAGTSLTTSGINQTGWVYVRLTDAAGNYRDVTQSVVVDNTIAPPTLAILQGGFTNTRNITLRATYTESYPRSIYAQTGTGNWTALSGLGDSGWALPAGDGTYIISIKLEDQARNMSSAVSQSIVLDTIAPVILGVTPSAIVATNGTINYLASAVIDTSQWAITSSVEAYPVTRSYRVQNSAGTSTGTQWTEGLNTVWVTLTDSAGNRSTEFGPISLVVDTTLPTLGVSANTIGTRYHSRTSTGSITVTATDANLRYFTYSVIRSGQATPVLTGTTTNSQISASVLAQSLSTGVYTLNIQAVDWVGKSSAVVSVPLAIDVTPPSLTAVSSSRRYIGRNPQTAVISASGQDADSGISGYHYFANNQWNNFVPGAATDLSALPDGDTPLKIRAMDSAGNPSSEVSLTIGMDRSDPVLGNVSLSATYVSANTQLTLNWGGASDTGISGIDHYEVRINGGSPVVSSTSPFTFAKGDGRLGIEGSNTFSAVVVDKAGNTSAETTGNYLIDTLAPAIQSTTVVSRSIINATRRPFEVAVSGSDDVRNTAGYWIESTLKNGNGQVIGTAITTTYVGVATPTVTVDSTRVTVDGVYSLTLVAQDAAGNRSAATVPISFRNDLTPPVLDYFVPGAPIQQQADAIASPIAQDTFVIASYHFVDNSGNTPTVSLRVFNTTNQTLISTNNNLQQTNGYPELRWDGYVRKDAIGVDAWQAQEGNYIAEYIATDPAGNIASTMNTFYLSNERLVGGTNAHTPSVTLNAGSLEIRWGEGARIDTSVSLRAPGRTSYGGFLGSEVSAAWGDTKYREFITDLPQTIWYRDDMPGDAYLDNRIYFKGLELAYEQELPNREPGLYTMSTQKFGFEGNDKGQTRTWKTYSNGYKKYTRTGSTFTPSATLDSSPTVGQVDNIIALYDAQNTQRVAFVQSANRDIYTYDGTPMSLRRESPVFISKNSTTGQYTASYSETRSTGNTLVATLPQVDRQTYEGRFGMEIINVSGGVNSTSKAIDSSGAVHLVWDDGRNTVKQMYDVPLPSQIYYKKIYPGKQYSTGEQWTIFSQPVIGHGTTPTVLALDAPKSTATDLTVCRTTCPEFNWHVPDNRLTPTTRFQILAKKAPVIGSTAGLPLFDVPTVNDTIQTIDVPAGTYTTSGNRVYFTPDHYNSLGHTSGADRYRWQVRADWRGDGVWEWSSTSEVFAIDPELGIEIAINYPNPFATTTRIRYKLSRDAASVSIRIFDLAGRLVRVLDDCPTQGTSITREYSDVLWDGRNGVGDEVVNGVYSYKIMAIDESGRKVTVKGRMAKLK